MFSAAVARDKLRSSRKIDQTPTKLTDYQLVRGKGACDGKGAPRLTQIGAPDEQKPPPIVGPVECLARFTRAGAERRQMTQVFWRKNTTHNSPGDPGRPAGWL